jgi:HAD superfamily hydrolase (TIGR01509 family)
MKAVFWDYDNTLVETEALHFEKHRSVLSRYGIVLEERWRGTIYHNNSHQNWLWLEKTFSIPVSKELYLSQIDLEFQKKAFALTLRPGVEKVMADLAALKIPQAIITNARKCSAEPVLIQKGILPLMQFALYSEDYEGRKPDPSPYLAGIQKMGVEAGECLAIEDDPKGVESAKRAGLIVIHRKLRREDPDSSFADYVCFEGAELISYVFK